MSPQVMVTNTSWIVSSKILQHGKKSLFKKRQTVHRFRHLSNLLRSSSQPTYWGRCQLACDHRLISSSRFSPAGWREATTGKRLRSQASC